MKKTVFYTVILGAVLIFNACSTSPVCITPAITPMQNKVIAENLGKTEGRDTAWSVLGLYMIGRPDLSVAIDRALKSKGGDTLINVSCYETWGYFVFASFSTVKVEGEAVRFAVEEPETKDKKRDKKR